MLLVELLASPAQAQADPVAAAYQRLEQLRSQLQLPALERNAALEAIATRQARSALARDDPRAPDLDSQVFGAVADARTASADLYVAQDLAALPASRGLGDARYSLVGIGAVRGDSPTVRARALLGGGHPRRAPLSRPDAPEGGPTAPGAGWRRPRCRGPAPPRSRRAGTSRR